MQPYSKPTLKRRVKEALKGFLHGVFVTAQHLGFDLLPRHFYSEIPIIHQLKKTDHWKKPYSMTGVLGADLDEQMMFVRECCTCDIVEKQKRFDIPQRALERSREVGFGSVDAEFLYSFILSKRPKRILQVGSGFSTAVCLIAADDAGYRPQITCIEPYASPFLQDANRNGEIQVIPKKLRLVSAKWREMVGEGDLFFVDSTHTLGPSGECSYIILEIVPLLPRGAWAHFHDIWFPYDYDPSLYSQMFFWHECVLLHGFLVHNSRFKIAASLSMLHHGRSEQLAEYLPNYTPAGHDYGLRTTPGHSPGSIYLKAIS